MDIKISLPKPNDTSGKKIKQFLRQMELCVHHLQKSVEEIEKNDPKDFENYFIIYRFPRINLYGRKQDDEGFAKVHVDEETDQMQEIEIELARG